MAGGVLIVAEHLERRIAPSTLELIAAARPLAQALGDERNARIAVLGHGVREIASNLAGSRPSAGPLSQRNRGSSSWLTPRKDTTSPRRSRGRWTCRS